MDKLLAWVYVPTTGSGTPTKCLFNNCDIDITLLGITFIVSIIILLWILITNKY